LLVLWTLFCGPASAADWSLEVLSIEVDGAEVARAALQVAMPQQVSAQTRIVERGERFAVGSVIGAPPRTTLSLKSSNSNSVRLLPGGRIRVLAGSELGEEVGLEAGQGLFDVKRALSFFNVRHGRFQAIVKGTVFSVRITAETEIAFKVEEGAVRIEREAKFSIDEGRTEGAINVVETLNAGESKSFSLSIDEYLARFEHFGEAEDFYRRSLEADRLSGDPDRIETGLARMGIVLLALSKYGDAISYFEACRRSVLERHPGGVHAAIAVSLNNLGVAYFGLSGSENLSRAMGYHEDSLSIRRQLYPGGVHADIAHSLGNLGNVYGALRGADNLRRAVRYYEEGLKVLRQIHADGVHADIAHILNNLGSTYNELGGIDNVQRAIRYHDEALKIRRHLYPSGVHADVAQSLTNLGAAYRGLGGTDNLQRALRQHEDGLKILRRIYPGGVHADIAHGLNNLGAIYRELGGIDNLDRAIRYQEDGLQIRRQLYPGGVHADIAQSLANLGSAYGTLGGAKNLKRAIGYYEDSLRISRQLYPGGAHVDIARVLGTLSFARLLAGQTEEALADARAALEIAPGEIWIRGNEAHALLLIGRKNEALEIYTQYGEHLVSAHRTFRASVLDDFAVLRKAGFDHPGMAAVEALYGRPLVPKAER
jgi:tetratricopeptide (TPR) repeat protein